MAIDRETLPYRASVGIVLLNADKKVFVGERIDTPGAWQFPQGGIDQGEALEAAAMRELYEEIGTDKAEILQIAPQTTRYDLPDHLLVKLWNASYRGQEQHWIAMQFTGRDSDINLSHFDPPEFSAWQWVAMHETIDLIVPFKRDTYHQVIAMFSDLIAD